MKSLLETMNLANLKAVFKNVIPTLAESPLQIQHEQRAVADAVINLAEHWGRGSLQPNETITNSGKWAR
jgi:hypothetical protein